MDLFTRFVVAIASVGALLMSIWNATQINIVHVSINSRMTDLIELTQKASKAEGVKEERDKKR